MIILIGASSGIGLRLINELIQYDDILATYNRKKINIKIKNKKNNLIIKKLDISNENNIKKFVNDNSKVLKRVTFLNLATISVDKLIVNLKSNDISRSFQINSFSNILFAKYLINIMIKDNFGRFISAGGETSGAIIKGLGVEELKIGKEISPGVPALWSPKSFGNKSISITLKSGNFGQQDFFSRALIELTNN